MTTAISSTDRALNEFALRCFRDVADGDYIAARMNSRAALISQFLWSSQQAIEKYLKCVLLLHRIKAADVQHDLEKALTSLRGGGIALPLCEPTEDFIKRLDATGRFRYMEVSHYSFGRDLLSLDRAVWEIRQHCTLAPGRAPQPAVEGVMPADVRLLGGHLEQILESRMREPGSARAALLWQNAFFGTKRRRIVRLGRWMSSRNSVLTHYPEIVDEVAKYVHLPKAVKEAYRKRAKEEGRRL